MSDLGFSRQAAVGIVITVALGLLAVAILMIGSASNMFTPKTHYTTNFQDALGLKVGSPVYMSGVPIGSVDSLELPTDPDREGISIGIAVDEQYAARVREGTTASLKFLQILSGDKLIILTPGDPARPALPSGSFIPPDEGGGIFEAGATAAESISQITAKLNEILAPIERGEGLIGKMIKQPDFGEEGLENINDTFAQASTLLREINDGEGMIGRLVTDREYAATTLGALKESLARMDSVLGRIERNEGALGALLEEGGEGEQAISELRAAAGEMRQILESIRHGDGLLSRLLYDEAFSKKLSDDLERSVSAMASILEKIDRGEGSAGAFINDDRVYETVNDIVTGINKSWLGKRMLRHYGKKGAKERLRMEAEEREESGGSPSDPDEAEDTDTAPGTAPIPGPASAPRPLP